MIKEVVENIPQETAGKVIVGVGATGSLAQMITEYANLFVACGNGVLVAVGLYLAWNKLTSKKRNRRQEDKDGA